MFQVRHKCPHCNHLVDFALMDIAQYNIKDPTQNQQATIHHYDNNDTTNAYSTACCPLCSSPVMFVFCLTLDQLKAYLQSSGTSQRLFREKQPSIIAVYPEKKTPYIHQDYPEEIKELFSNAQQLMYESRPPAMIIAACGSVLEMSLKVLNIKGGHFKQMIDNCLKQGLITKALADWSHHLRITRNQAMHEIKASNNDAEEIVAFIIFFLDLTFVIPADIERKKASRND